LRLPGLCLLAALAGVSPAKPPARAAPPQPSGPERDAAVASALRRAEGATPGGPEARRLAVELQEFGSGYLRSGDSGRAIELLGEAYALDEGNGSALAELTLAYAKEEDYDAAAFYLRLAEERGAAALPETLATYSTLGEIFYGVHRLEDAVVAWSEAARLGGQDPVLLRRLARSRDELAVARGQRSLSTENFSLFAEPAIPESILRDAADDLEAAHRAQSAFFGVPLARRQVVVLYGGRAFFALASVPDWVSGVYDGKIRVALRAAAADDPAALSTVLAHELAHALMRQASGDRAPGWLHEGLAQWLEGRRLSREEARAAMRGRGAGSIEELESRFPGAMDRAQARALYAQSLSLVEYVVSVRGEGALACVVARLREGDSIADALRAETALGPRELFQGWRAWIGA
jgi:tetratricopeptide (TPR) repeat protein